ncbi:amidohydrolase family protein [Vineibacter terrae]|uniref:Amidohydrolase family protein n=1 Tax=Vineibacter terrae TaxID=2586908 RepID=A0A5C8PUK7_9HYPH|nr:amidohydrolase family protein [Vineibacter terrae]TXL81589.1 amidohydrolase family protein [Vineibacter terrae]
MTPKTTHIRNLDVAVAWDEAEQCHVYLQGADLVFRGNEIVHAGPGYADAADTVIEGGGMMAMPGLVNIHSHPFSEPGNKGLTEEVASDRLGQSSLYEYLPVFGMEADAAGASSRFALSELLKSGVTTICDLSINRDGWIDDLASTGIRAVLCPMYRSGHWYTKNGHAVDYAWDEKAGEQAFAAALQTIDHAAQHPSGRLSGMVGPAQIDTCTEGLFKDSLAEARRRGIPMQTHAGQAIVEFNEMVRRHGKTPIEWLDQIGVLGPDLIIGHGIFLSDHPQLHWPHSDDFARLRASGAAVAHCPTVFARRGIALNTIGRYMDAGIPLGMGTDTFPHNMLDEMRLACYVARVVSGNYKHGQTRHALEAATVGGAGILRRPDLGRLLPGCKADFALIDLHHPYMQPPLEPMRSLIYSASDRAVRHVYVDGIQVVRDGNVLTIDIDAAVAAMNDGQRRRLATVPQRDWAGRTAQQLAPPVLAARDRLPQSRPAR